MSEQKKETVSLLIRKRDRVLFDGEVTAFTSYNAKGVFDVLSNHTNFISIINKQYVIHKVDGTTSEMSIDDGILSVYNNRISVFLGIGH